MWSHSGSIITNAARVYYWPSAECLPPLRWLPEKQRFAHLNSQKNTEDAMIRAALCNLAASAGSPATKVPRSGSGRRAGSPGIGEDTFLSTLTTMTSTIACECIYGVLPLGPSTSVLLYVTKKTHATALSLPARGDSDGTAAPGSPEVRERQRHEVYLVRKLEWMRLPSRVTQARSSAPTPLTHARDRGASDDDDDREERISEEVVAEYLKVVDAFCNRVSDDFGERSYLYFSPTINIALNPEELLRDGLGVPGAPPLPPGCEPSLGSILPPTPPSSNSRASVGRADHDRTATAASVFQWNAGLLQAFDLPRDEAELEGEMNLAASARVLRRWASSPAPPDSSGDGSEGRCTYAAATAPWSGVRMTDVCGEECFNPTMLYAPCFMRGLVAAYDVEQESRATLPMVHLHLFTRLSARWAGTRYNRRGLDPSGAGIPANCAVTSLWVTTSSPGRREREASPATTPSLSGAGTAQRIAVFSMLRGSVPRRWEQPADFGFKPPLRILHPSGGMDELLGHLRFLNHLVPNMAKVACVDTTSSSKLEGPLSDAFVAAVGKVQRRILRSAAPSLSGEPNDGSDDSGETDLPAEALNAKTPLSFMKFDMKKKLKVFSYGELRRNLLSEVVQNNMGLAGPVRGDVPADAPTWLDFTECSFPRRRGHVSSQQSGTPVPCDDGANPAASIALHEQALYFRVNCLDCLDRTNLLQALLAESTLPHMLSYVLGEPERGGGGGGGGSSPARRSNGSSASAADTAKSGGQPAGIRDTLRVIASTALRRLLAQQGIAVSEMYANTEAHFIPFLLASDFSNTNDNNESSRYRPTPHELLLALRRWFFQAFRDGKKQDAISLLTQQHGPALYPCDIDSPFSRDLTSMNNHVFYGILFALIPCLFSVFSILFFTTSSTERNVHAALSAVWVVFFGFLFNKLSANRISYTNRPLLGYTWSGLRT